MVVCLALISEEQPKSLHPHVPNLKKSGHGQRSILILICDIREPLISAHTTKNRKQSGHERFTL